ncbi:hypothetical protein EC609_31915 [Achromobacter denitrificans]|nr:hypothetical protein EC609_31915 [Achromobacter denitrificans]
MPKNGFRCKRGFPGGDVGRRQWRNAGSAGRRRPSRAPAERCREARGHADAGGAGGRRLHGAGPGRRRVPVGAYRARAAVGAARACPDDGQPSPGRPGGDAGSRRHDRGLLGRSGAGGQPAGRAGGRRSRPRHVPVARRATQCAPVWRAVLGSCATGATGRLRRLVRQLRRAPFRAAVLPPGARRAGAAGFRHGAAPGDPGHRAGRPYNAKAYPKQGIDAFQTYSVLELADAPPQPWVEARADVPAGTVETRELRSKILGNTRKIHLYRPAGWRSAAADNHVLVLFDAGAYLGRVPTPTILDNMIAAGVIPPTAALLIDNPTADSRSQELPPNPDFADFLARELMPWARKHGIGAPAARTVIGGSSYGGLASAYAALRHPEVFGNVLSQSGSYWWSPAGEEDQWLTRQFAAVRTLPVRFFLGAGLFESGRGGQPGILETNRHLRDVLRAKGYWVTHREIAGGHDYLVWRGTLSDGLLELIGTGKPARR